MLQELKNKLDISWSDEDTKVTEIIARGKAYLNSKAGVHLNFEVEGQAKLLLFEYCRYDYNNAVEFFEENFSREISLLQLLTGVEQLPTDEVTP